ncbi:hypothetical protein TRVA0_008S00254 [Trichomonascus vanleenenianus]|uniref:uncharacterized protein n=1 Tax=Trichomonascus vanleenenianus TaxID=2268995 RepID=UPI003EC99FED
MLQFQRKKSFKLDRPLRWASFRRKNSTRSTTSTASRDSTSSTSSASTSATSIASIHESQLYSEGSYTYVKNSIYLSDTVYYANLEGELHPICVELHFSLAECIGIAYEAYEAALTCSAHYAKWLELYALVLDICRERCCRDAILTDNYHWILVRLNTCASCIIPDTFMVENGETYYRNNAKISAYKIVQDFIATSHRDYLDPEIRHDTLSIQDMLLALY